MKHLKKGITVLIIITLFAGISPNVPYSSIIANATSCYQDLYDGEYSSNLGEYAANIAGANYGREMWSYYKQAWCADFACDCWRKVGVGTDIVPNEPSAPGLVTWFMNNNPSGVYYRQSGNSSYSTFKKGYYEPKKGDIVGICNGASGCLGKDGFGSGNRHCVDHIGIIYNVTDDKIITMEGNCGDPSKVKSYEYNWNNGTSNGYGYTWNGKEAWIQYVCHPAYTNSDPLPAPTLSVSTENTSNKDIVFTWNTVDDVDHFDLRVYYYGQYNVGAPYFYTISASQTRTTLRLPRGKYAAYITAVGINETESPSNWVAPIIVSDPPSAASLTINSILVTDNIEKNGVEFLWTSADNADHYDLRIYHHGEYNVGAPYYIFNIPASQNRATMKLPAGKYAAYITTVTESGASVGSEWITAFNVLEPEINDVFSYSIKSYKMWIGNETTAAYDCTTFSRIYLNDTEMEIISIYKNDWLKAKIYDGQVSKMVYVPLGGFVSNPCSTDMLYCREDTTVYQRYTCENSYHNLAKDTAVTVIGTYGDQLKQIYYSINGQHYLGWVNCNSLCKHYPAGDANNDDEVNLKDVAQITRYLAGGWDVTVDLATADVNKDGEVNLKDAVILRRYLAGGWGVQLA